MSYFPHINGRVKWEITANDRPKNDFQYEIIKTNAAWHNFWAAQGQDAPGDLPQGAIAIHMNLRATCANILPVATGPHEMRGESRYEWYLHSRGGVAMHAFFNKAAIQLVKKPVQEDNITLQRIDPPRAKHLIPPKK